MMSRFSPNNNLVRCIENLYCNRSEACNFHMQSGNCLVRRLEMALELGRLEVVALEWMEMALLALSEMAQWEVMEMVRVESELEFVVEEESMSREV